MKIQNVSDTSRREVLRANSKLFKTQIIFYKNENDAKQCLVLHILSGIFLNIDKEG